MTAAPEALYGGASTRRITVRDLAAAKDTSAEQVGQQRHLQEARQGIVGRKDRRLSGTASTPDIVTQ